MGTPYQVVQQELFNFKRPEEWPRWSRRFEHFRSASGLKDKDEETQVPTLVYRMGDEADDLLSSFGLSDADKKKYDTVLGKFEGHFVQRKNVILERAKFNKREQGEAEPVDPFVTDLYRLAKHCGYGTLHDEMIRDRTVSGLRE